MICPHCGKQTGKADVCVHCGASTEFARRIVYQSVGNSTNVVSGSESVAPPLPIPPVLPPKPPVQPPVPPAPRKRKAMRISPWYAGVSVVLIAGCIFNGIVSVCLWNKLAALGGQVDTVIENAANVREEKIEHEHEHKNEEALVPAPDADSVDATSDEPENGFFKEDSTTENDPIEETGNENYTAAGMDISEPDFISSTDIQKESAKAE